MSSCNKLIQRVSLVKLYPVKSYCISYPEMLLSLFRLITSAAKSQSQIYCHVTDVRLCVMLSQDVGCIPTVKAKCYYLDFISVERWYSTCRT